MMSAGIEITGSSADVSPSSTDVNLSKKTFESAYFVSAPHVLEALPSVYVMQQLVSVMLKRTASRLIYNRRPATTMLRVSSRLLADRVS